MKARVIAYYLPQFHPIPENDAVWGKGFTEWTNVAKAKPLFRGHYQPRIPADLGFYDLRLPEVREQQAELAREAGVEGFCYWHYWFGGGKMLLERPFKEVLESGKPDFPFCLAYVLPAFKDHRYITVDGKPLFCIYDPYKFPDVEHFMRLWREWAKENGLPGIFFVAMCNSTTTIRRKEDGSLERVMPNLKSSAEVYQPFLDLGFDGINSIGKKRAEMITSGKYLRIMSRALHKLFPSLSASHFDYPRVMAHCFAPEDAWENVFPSILPQWDRTPRAGNNEGIYVNATPENFLKHIEDALQVIKEKQPEHQLLFLKSWNEWGEGNYVEPDQKYGHGYLNALQKALL